MKDSPHSTQGRTTRILFAMLGTLFLLLLLAFASKGVNPYCGEVVTGYKTQRCVGIR